MKKLTAEKCREQIAEWEKMMKDWDLSIASFKHLQAYRIALPILEQQEQKEKVTLRDGLAALSAHIDSIGGYNFEALEAYRREEFGQQERGDGWIEWGGGECPVQEDAIVAVKYSDDGEDGPGPSYSWHWEHIGHSQDVFAYRIIPEQPTNQNGEQ